MHGICTGIPDTDSDSRFFLFTLRYETKSHLAIGRDVKRQKKSSHGDFCVTLTDRLDMVLGFFLHWGIRDKWRYPW
jgi:hypothetical protein